MGQLEQAIKHMAEHEQMTDFFCWYSVDKLGHGAWHASVKTEERFCHTAEGATPEDALLGALGQAYADRKEGK